MISCVGSYIVFLLAMVNGGDQAGRDHGVGDPIDLRTKHAPRSRGGKAFARTHYKPCLLELPMTILRTILESCDNPARRAQRHMLPHDVVVAPRYARTLGSGGTPMQRVGVTQWVSTAGSGVISQQYFPTITTS